MIISHRHRFIFIKTRKTAGTSIEVFLSQHCGDDDVVTPIHPHVEPHVARNHLGLWNPLPEIIANGGRGIGEALRGLAGRNRFYNHIPAATVKKRVPRRIWNSYYKFCVERNPWDKTLSHYHMLNDRQGGGLSLDEYLAGQDLCLNLPNYTDARGNLLVDEVVRYEDLTGGLGRVFGELGIPFDGSLGVKAKAGHRKDRRPYREVFTDQQRRAIQQAFAREIDLHGYAF